MYLPPLLPPHAFYVSKSGLLWWQILMTWLNCSNGRCFGFELSSYHVLQTNNFPHLKECRPLYHPTLGNELWRWSNSLMNSTQVNTSKTQNRGITGLQGKRWSTTVFWEAADCYSSFPAKSPKPQKEVDARQGWRNLVSFKLKRWTWAKLQFVRHFSC